LERIPTDRIAKLIENIAAHLAPDGIFVASVDIMPDCNPVLGATYHLTLQPKNWWLEQSAAECFRESRAESVQHTRLRAKKRH